jgi:hypothetical protein
MRTMYNSETLTERGCSLLVLNLDKKEQEKCLSSTKRAEKEYVGNSRTQRKGRTRNIDKKFANYKGKMQKRTTVDGTTRMP